MNANELLYQLRKFVLIKSGLRNIDPGHCKTISEYVFIETKNYVSETTIKRFFGFANTLHKFSLFTLNSLSQYVGYKDWEAFCSDKENQDVSTENIWQSLKIKSQAITDVALIAKKNNSGVPFSYTSKRNLVYPDFNFFLKNNYQFTTLSAYPGHGKSILLAHLVEHFFLTEKAVYPKDIVLLINSTIVRNIIQNDLSIKDWFFQEFKFNNLSEMIAYFNKNKEKREGRFILIIDGLDEYLSKTTYLNVLVDILQSIQENNFVKVVLGLRSSTWTNLQPAISGSAFLTNSWYKGLFVDAEGHSNIPPLNEEEISYTLSKIEGEELRHENISPVLFNQFKTPFWMQIYYGLKQENSLLEPSNPALYYELINYFLEKKIFLSRNSTEKIFLLKKIAEYISEGNKGLRAAKDQILNYVNLYPDVYRDLLWTGILVEEKRLTTSIPTEIVRFLSDDIYTYFIFIHLTEKYHYKTDVDFFREILQTYSKQPFLRMLILNWSIRFCISRNQVEPLKNIFKLPFTNKEKNDSFDFICNVASHELKKPISNFNPQTIDQHFVDIMVMGKITGQYYNNTIRDISNKLLNEDVQLILHVIECTIYIMDVDKTALNNTMQILKQNYKKLGEIFPLNPYDLILYFYNNLVNKQFESKSLDEKILSLCRELDSSKPAPNDALTAAEILTFRLLLYILFAQKNYAECHRFIMAILNKYPNIFYVRYSFFSSYLLLTLGQTYLKLHYYKKTKRIIQFVDRIIESDFTYHTPYVEVSFNILKANFYCTTGHYEDGLAEINKGLILAGENNFNRLRITLLLIQIDILKHLDATEKVSVTIKQLMIFLTEQKINLPDYANVNHADFDHTFNILKSYKPT